MKIDDPSTQVLASGIDSLNLAIDVYWSNTDFFDYLNTLKDSAKSNHKDTPGALELDEGRHKWPFNIKPHGKNGYEWMLSNKEFTLFIGAWKRPQAKPSVLVEIRSETLWHLGAENAVDKIKEILLAQGGTRIIIKPSRVDFCADILLPEEKWSDDLRKNAITRSTYTAPHFEHKKLTGISIGKGKLSCRLYDKAKEIEKISKKYWMYEIWGLKKVPENWKVIRVEFQFRRELLKQLAVNDISDLFLHCDNIWAYCTQRWLKFQTNPEKHHTQRSTLDWWQEVQNGFLGVQDPIPLVRSKALNFDIQQNTTQAIGHIRALIAAKVAAQELDEFVPAEIEDGIENILREVNKTEESKAEFSDSVRKKIAKFFRTNSRHFLAEAKRNKFGFPTETNTK